MFTTFSNKANVVWSDDFNDGYYDGWTVLNGTFVIEDGVLKTGTNSLNVIRCPSYGPSSGTWSFDLLANGWTLVYFVDNSQQDLVILFYPGQAYEVERLDVINLTYSESATVRTDYSQAEFLGKAGAWQHLNVTRNLEGRICVYDNGTLVANYVDNTYIPPPNYFVLYSSSGAAAIDNIVVSDTVDLEPTDSTPFYMQTWFLAAVASVIIIIIVITVLFIRKK